MKAFKLIAAALIILTFSCNSNDQSEFIEIAGDLKEATLTNDTDAIMSFVHQNGTYFLDTAYSKQEIANLLNDKESWLYEHLFSGEKSVRDYFVGSEGLEVKVLNKSKNAVMLSFQAKNVDSADWVECCLIRISGKWYLDGIFLCE